MLILPMVGFLHRAITVVLFRGKRGQKLLAKRTKVVCAKTGKNSELRAREILNIVIGGKRKTAAKGKRRAGNLAPALGRKAKLSRKNQANAAPNANARGAVRRIRRRKARSQ